MADSLMREEVFWGIRIEYELSCGGMSGEWLIFIDHCLNATGRSEKSPLCCL
jgi:hypothetical protein